jgi:hypothetical protein
MRLVWIGRAAYEVVAIADDSLRSFFDELESADPSDGGAEQMRAALEQDIPRNGRPTGKSRCRYLGDDIWEFKEWNVRVLWFYDAGEPTVRRRFLCTHYCRKLPKKKFQQEKRKAVRIRRVYLEDKAAGRLPPPEERRR